MNVALAAVLSSLQGVLRDDVLPALSSEHARTQTVAVIDVLEKLTRLADWSPDMLRGRIKAMETGAAAFRRRVGELGHALPEPNGASGEDLTQEELRSKLSLMDEELVRLVDWLFDRHNDLNAGERQELQAILRDAIQASQAEERRLIPLSDFAASS